MSDEQTQAGGYENDLREAENAMTAAGHPDIALGMRRHSEAQRNMMQGVLVPMFVTMVERVMGQKLDPIAEQIGGLRSDSAALQAEFQSGLSAVQQTVSLLSETIDGMQTELAQVKAQVRIIEKNTLANVVSQEERARLIDLARGIPDLVKRVTALEAATSDGDT